MYESYLSKLYFRIVDWWDENYFRVAYLQLIPFFSERFFCYFFWIFSMTNCILFQRISILGKSELGWLFKVSCYPIKMFPSKGQKSHYLAFSKMKNFLKKENYSEKRKKSKFFWRKKRPVAPPSGIFRSMKSWWRLKTWF